MPLLILVGLGIGTGFLARGSLDPIFDFFSGNDAKPLGQENTGFFSNPWALGLLGLAAGMIINELIN